jgi:hypothetical protein
MNTTEQNMMTRPSSIVACAGCPGSQGEARSVEAGNTKAITAAACVLQGAVETPGRPDQVRPANDNDFVGQSGWCQLLAAEHKARNGTSRDCCGADPHPRYDIPSHETKEWSVSRIQKSSCSTCRCTKRATRSRKPAILPIVS